MTESLPFQRASYGEPSHPDRGVVLPKELVKICFRHPAYDDSENIMMILPGLDHPQGGIHHLTARIACSILANNSWSGFFTEDKAGKRKTAAPEHGILRERNYYFLVSDDALGEQKFSYPPSCVSVQRLTESLLLQKGIPSSQASATGAFRTMIYQRLGGIAIYRACLPIALSRGRAA
jgi:hypothetical protein